MNVIVRLEFELTCFEAAIQHFSHYALGTPQLITGKYPLQKLILNSLQVCVYVFPSFWFCKAPTYEFSQRHDKCNDCRRRKWNRTPRVQNPGSGCLRFILCKCPWKKYEPIYSLLPRADRVISPWLDCDTVSSSVARGTYLGAVMHMRVGSMVSIWICICIGVVRISLYAWGCNHIYIGVMALEGVTKRTEHHGISIGIYLQEQRMVTRT